MANESQLFNLSDFLEQNLKHSYEWSVSFIMIYSTIFAFGITGNSIVILVFYTRPAFQTATNIFILNLAAADLLVVLFCLPATLFTTLFKTWLLGNVMCKSIRFVQGISIFASAYSLVAISIDRCRGVRSIQTTHRLSKFKANVIATLIWICASILFIPWLIVFEETPYGTSQLHYCLENWNAPLHGIYYSFFFNLLVCYIVPLIIILSMNICIWVKVSSRDLSMTSASFREIRKAHRKTEVAVGKMLTLTISAFLLCWLPFYIVISRVKMSSFLPICETELHILNMAIPLVQLLGLSNSCLNPLIYSYTNPKFCRAVRSLIFKQSYNDERLSFQPSQYSMLSRSGRSSMSITPKQSILVDKG